MSINEIIMRNTYKLREFSNILYIKSYQWCLTKTMET